MEVVDYRGVGVARHHERERDLVPACQQEDEDKIKNQDYYSVGRGLGKRALPVLAEMMLI